MESKIVRAVDCGYGYTKFTLNDGITGEGIAVQSFPSIAIPSINQGQQFVESARNTIRVVVGKNSAYEVGHGVTALMDPHYSRQLDLKYAESSAYLALTLGAVHYMNVSAIDLLVVGLPVKNFTYAAPILKERLRRTHVLPTKEVEIKDVLVIPQPVGGMVDFAVQSDSVQALQDQNVLIIDPGYFTLDWVIAKGMVVNWNRSGAVTDAGMAAFLRKTFDQITSQFQKQFVAEATESNLIRLDDAIRNKHDYRLHGKSINVEQFASARVTVMKDGLRKLMTSVVDISDVDSIVLVGGGASQQYKEVVQAYFGEHQVFAAKDPAFSNTRGFQFLGNKRAMAMSAASSSVV